LAAHGKTEILTFEKQLARDESGFPVRPRSALEAFCTLEMAGQLFEDCGSIITEIHRAAGREDQALWLTSHTQWTRTFKKNH
jgi:hypothetical protein